VPTASPVGTDPEREATGTRTVAPVGLWPVAGLPMFRAGDDLAAAIGDALERENLLPIAGDVLAVAQKVVSKCEGRLRDLGQVVPSPRARKLAARVGKDPRLVELVLAESRAVLRAERDVLIVEHRCGFIMANAGIDQSNVGVEGHDAALLLPIDCDASAALLRAALAARFGVDVAVLVNDSFGRPWRNGVTGVCLGAAGLATLIDGRGRVDAFGRALRSTEIAHGDELAAAASIVMGQADERVPVVLIRGVTAGADAAARPAQALLRPRERDLFR